MKPKSTIIVIFIMLAAYLIGYAGLSVGGSSVPIEQSMQGTRWSWAPRGFTAAFSRVRFQSALVTFPFQAWLSPVVIERQGVLNRSQQKERRWTRPSVSSVTSC